MLGLGLGLMGAGRRSGSDPTLTLWYDFATLKTLAAKNSLGPTLSITRATEGRYWDSDGVLQTAALGVARFDHDPGNSNASLGLLVEPLSINRVRQSEDLSTTWTASNGSTITSSGTAPDAGSAQDVLHSLTNSFFQQTNTVTADVPHCFSVFVHQGDTGDHDWIRLSFRDSGANNGVQAWFNRSTGSVGTSGTTGSGTTLVGTFIDDVGNGWLRLSLVGQLASGVTSLRSDFHSTVSDNNTTSETTDSVLYWGFMVEPSSVPTSYIPTTTAAVTRNADVVSTTTLSWLDAAATAVGAWYLKGSFPHADAAAHALLTLDDGGTTDRFYFERDAAENINFAVTNSADNDGLVSGTAVIAENTPFKVAASYADDDIVSAIDGSLETADTAVGIPLTDNPTTLRIGADSGGNQWNGHIAEVRYYNVQKDDDFLTSLST